MAKKKKNQKKDKKIEVKQPSSITLNGNLYKKKEIIDPITKEKEKVLAEVEYWEITHELSKRSLYRPFKELSQAVKFCLGPGGKFVTDKNYSSGGFLSEEHGEQVMKDYIQWQKMMKKRKWSMSPIIEIATFSMTLTEIAAKYKKNFTSRDDVLRHLLRSLRIWAVYE